jgi:ankyrin repeat protein
MAYGDYEQCVRKLVAAGSKIPNVYAVVILGDVGRLAELLKAKPELANARNRYGEPILQMAAERGDTEILKVLLNTKAEIDAVGKQTNRGISKEYTALHAAVVGGKTHAAKLLLERGANPNIIDTWKKTPLHYAAENGKVEIVKALLAHQADLTIKDTFGRSPLDFATKEIREAVADWEKSKK